MNNEKSPRGLAIAAALVVLVGLGCSLTTSVGVAPPTNDLAAAPDTPPAGGFSQPAGTVAVSYSVDDTANRVYGSGDLQWKGSMIYDPTTRIITPDPTWSGPWADLYDDGPWNQGNPAGHEPIGSTAGDHRWGVAVFVTPPASGSATYEYGLNDTYYEAQFGNGWIWRDPNNGTFTVEAAATAALIATGQRFLPFGATDLLIVIDTNALDPSAAWDTSIIRIKGSVWGWALTTVPVGADGLATFTLSDVVGAGRAFTHTGLLNSGDGLEFTLVFGPGDGVEYRDLNGAALTSGVTAFVQPAGASPAPANIQLATDNNSYVAIP